MSVLSRRIHAAGMGERRGKMEKRGRGEEVASPLGDEAPESCGAEPSEPVVGEKVAEVVAPSGVAQESKVVAEAEVVAEVVADPGEAGDPEASGAMEEEENVCITAPVLAEICRTRLLP